MSLYRLLYTQYGFSTEYGKVLLRYAGNEVRGYTYFILSVPWQVRFGHVCPEKSVMRHRRTNVILAIAPRGRSSEMAFRASDKRVVRGPRGGNTGRGRGPGDRYGTRTV